MDNRMNPEYLKSLPLSERMKVKAQVKFEIEQKALAEKKKREKNAKRRARYYIKHIADKQCICNECGLTKTYKEMAFANRRSPKNEDNLCSVCIENEIETEKLLEQLENYEQQNEHQ